MSHSDKQGQPGEWALRGGGESRNESRRAVGAGVPRWGRGWDKD